MSGSGKRTYSERLQMKALKEINPEEFEEDYCIVFFVTELKYSVVEMKNVHAGPADLDGKIEVMGLVTVKDGPKKYNATVMFIGSQEDCARRVEALEGRSKSAGQDQPEKQHDDPDDDTMMKPTGPKKQATCRKPKHPIVKVLDEEVKKVKQLSKAMDMNKDKNTCSFSDDDYQDGHDEDYVHSGPSWKEPPSNPWQRIFKTLDQILSRVTNIELKMTTMPTANRETETFVETPPPTKKIKVGKADQSNLQAAEGCEDAAASNTPSLMYNGTNILTISSGGDIKKYALRVFSHIFNTNEMAEGIIDPNQRARANGKVELDAKRVELLKKAIALKFGETVLNKKWPVIRQSLNQKCLDTKRKIKLEMLNNEAEQD